MTVKEQVLHVSVLTESENRSKGTHTHTYMELQIIEALLKPKKIDLLY